MQKLRKKQKAGTVGPNGKLTFIALFLSVFMFQGCEDSKCSKIGKKLSDICSSLQNNDCLISLTDIVQEDWDYVFLASEQLSLEEINEYLGFNYPYFEDIGKKMIFVKDNQVIYYEDVFPDYDNRRSCELLFEFRDERHYLKIKREDAVFKVLRKGDDFLLIPLGS